MTILLTVILTMIYTFSATVVRLAFAEFDEEEGTSSKNQPTALLLQFCPVLNTVVIVGAIAIGLINRKIDA